MTKKHNLLLTLMGLEIGGAETHVVELSRGLTRKGFNVIVASNGGIYQKELEDNNIKHYKTPLHNKNPYNVLKSYKLLKTIIKEENIDLVHAHARIPAYICGKLHKKMKFPFVTTAHGVFNSRWGLKYITNWGQETIAVSEDIKKYLIDKYKIEANKIKLTINGIDTKRFSKDIENTDIKEEFQLNDKDLHIVYISRLDSGNAKIAFQLMEIIPQIADKIKNIKILIIGDGNLYQEIKNKADAINKETGKKLIIMTGARTDINKFIALSDLCIGVSRVALEAMSAEKPVIIAGNEGYIGIFEESKLDTSIRCNFTCRGQVPSNNKMILRDIIHILTETDSAKRAKMGTFAKEIIEKYYSVEKMIQDNIEVYKKVLKR